MSLFMRALSLKGALSAKRALSQKRAIFTIFHLAVFIALNVSISTPAYAQINVGKGGGTGNCRSVVREITKNWSYVKQAMLPHRAKMKRAEEENFYCISPRAVQNAMERNVSQLVELKCFSTMQDGGLGMCCDLRVTACARLRPDAVTIVPRQVAKKKVDPNAKPSSVSWMKVPGDEDQWKTPTKD